MNEPRSEQFLLPALTESEARELAAGRVPDWLREACRSLTDWALEVGDVSYVGLAEQRQRKRKTA